MKWLQFSPLLLVVYNSTSPIKEPASVVCQDRSPSSRLYVQVCGYDIGSDGSYEEVRSHVERDDNGDGIVDYVEDCVQESDYSIRECVIEYSHPEVRSAKYSFNQ